jgi:hypothetical protein
MVSRVSFQGLYGRVSLQVCMGGPNISGVQISRDRPPGPHYKKHNTKVTKEQLLRAHVCDILYAYNFITN